LADKFAAQLDVLNVFPGYMLTKLGTREAGEKALKEFYEKAKNDLYGFFRDSGLEGSGTVEGGEPGRRIVSYSKEKDIDLIVMGARGLGLFRSMLIGSVTDAVLKFSPCPVFVIH
jgi:nucleotide-binding universal stress UspA family protein